MSRAEETRKRLQDTALRLFGAHGFDGVTVEQIALAAGVSHMTFFRHFPTKESVVLDDPYDPVIAESITLTDRRLTPSGRIAAGLLSAWSQLDEPDASTTRARVGLAASHPSLRARVWENNRRTEDVMVERLVADGVPTTDARIAAGAVLGAITAAIFDWAEDEAGGSLGERVGRAMAVFSAGSTEQHHV